MLQRAVGNERLGEHERLYATWRVVIGGLGGMVVNVYRSFGVAHAICRQRAVCHRMRVRISPPPPPHPPTVCDRTDRHSLHNYNNNNNTMQLTTLCLIYKVVLRILYNTLVDACSSSALYPFPLFLALTHLLVLVFVPSAHFNNLNSVITSLNASHKALISRS